MLLAWRHPVLRLARDRRRLLLLILRLLLRVTLLLGDWGTVWAGHCADRSAVGRRLDKRKAIQYIPKSEEGYTNMRVNAHAENVRCVLSV